MTTRGEGRYWRDRARGVRDRAVGIDDPILTDNMAYDAEVFFGNQYDGLTSFADETMPTTCDFSAGTACLDIKWTRYEKGGLIVTKWDDKKHYCSAYVLVIGFPPIRPFRVVGWASAQEVRESWRDDLRRPAHYIKQDDLHDDIDDVMAEWFGVTRREDDDGAA